MKEELMRRISAALDAPDGLAGDPALQTELRADADAAKYAKDLTRVGKWLATWPLPEPDDAAFEALASRIEQRLGDPLPTASDPTALPTFDDDDALRDATASLLQSGEFPAVSDSAIELVSDPSIPMLSDPSIALVSDPGIPIPELPPPPAPAAIARVPLAKARPAAVVEESAAGASGEPRSAAELERSLKSDPGKPKKKKAKKPGERSSLAPVESGDRVSIPTPKPALGAPSLTPVVQLPTPEERRPAATFWWFAAAAAVGLGVFGAATLFEGQRAPAAESAHGSTLVTSGAISPAATPSSPASLPSAPPPPTALAPVVAVAPPATAAPVDLPDRAHAEEEILAEARQADTIAPPATAAGLADPSPARGARPMRMAGSGAATASGDDLLGAAASSGRARATPSTTPAPAPTAAPVTSARTATAPEPASPHVAEAEPEGPVPATPDRATIQAVLAARTDAVTACAAGAHGLADVDIVIASSGRITTATVNGTFAGTPVGSCIARAVRGATFPPFSQPRFEVTYPFHL